MAQVTGRVFIRVNGEVLESKTGAKLSNITGVRRKAVVGNTVHGYAEEAVAPSIECKISHTSSTRLLSLGGFVDGDVQFVCDTGTVYILQEAWLEEPPDLTAGEGEVSLKFTGRRVWEVA